MTRDNLIALLCSFTHSHSYYDTYLNLLWSEFVETDAMFRSTSTDIGHALVVCDLTQIPAEGSGCRWGAVGIPDHDSWAKSQTTNA